jgi:predicted RNA-binding Zn-ribbon protein involved in translation (DUF1610 family)
MAKREKMICSECGMEMNHHAEKIDYTLAPGDENAGDADFGGALQEVHSCPQCGKTEMRRAA